MSYPITSRFLQQESFRSKGHSGIDFAMDNLTPLRSIKDGIISYADYGSANAGKTVFVKWEDGTTAIYGHLSKFNSFKEGEVVHAGDIIGYSGNSGHVVGSNGGYHLHFGLKSEDGKFLDPSSYIDSIQNMNNPQFLANLPPKEEIISQTQSFFDILKDSSDIYGSFFQSLKLNIINLIYSIDYSMVIEHVQNLLQLFS